MPVKRAIGLLVVGLLAAALWPIHAPERASAQIPDKYREVVAKGLDYLAKQQRADGHWEGDGGAYPVATTGLAGLALLMNPDQDRSSPGRHADNLRKSSDWLLAQNDPRRDGLFFSGHPSETSRYLRGHALAMIYLTGDAQRATSDDLRRKKLHAAVVGGMQYLDKSRSSMGGWYDTSTIEGHDLDLVLSTALQLQALRAARSVGVAADRLLIEGLECNRTAIDKHAKAPPSRKGTLETAAALVSRFQPHGNDQPSLPWFRSCDAAFPVGREVEFGRDDLGHYFFAQAKFAAGGKEWIDYRDALFDQLQLAQNKDGSWPAIADSPDELGVGAVYATALWCTVMQLENRRHPCWR